MSSDKSTTTDLISDLVDEELKLIIEIVNIERKYVYGMPDAPANRRQKEISDFLEQHMAGGK